ncbi:MAG: DHH family phosphoesterase, partial [Thaumarchaeota archaeon]|nr:DHH family phosphoesterase [Nitrososphaerota archaeon]
MGKILQEHLSNFSDKISDLIKNNKSISVTTHIDCDGLTSGAIITKALIRAGAKVTVRTAKEMSLGTIKMMRADSSDFH